MLIVDLQSNLTEIGSRVVAPLRPVERHIRNFTRLEPIFQIEGRPHALHVGELAAIPARLVEGDPVANLSERDYEIRGALDMLFSGF